jgi:concanavalin A-like lectin/glucanase superfamily protein
MIHGIVANQGFGGGGGGGGVDPFFANVKLLMHCEGANDTEGYIDSSANHFSLTSAGSATLHKTAQFKFGSSSILYPNLASFNGIRVNGTGALQLANSDFTIEFFVRHVGSSPQQTYLARYAGIDGNRDWWVRLKTGNFLEFAYSPTGSDAASVNSSQAWTPSVNTWYHVAVCRSGANLRTFVDGSQLGTTHNIGTTTIHNGNADWRIGGFFAGGGDILDTAQPLNGYMDELRVTIGTARYTANFSPPTAAFPDA